VGFGFLLVGLTPLGELFVWAGAGDASVKMSDVLRVMPFFAGIPLVLGLLALGLGTSAWADRPQLPVAAGLLLVVFVTPIGGVLAAHILGSDTASNAIPGGSPVAPPLGSGQDFGSAPAPATKEPSVLDGVLLIAEVGVVPFLLGLTLIVTALWPKRASRVSHQSL